MTRCDAETNRGRRCSEDTEVFPCRYHDRLAFNAALDALADLVRRAGGWPAFIAAHMTEPTPIRRRRERRTG